jgi:glycosyltransferase involved in cell wall biosynthesis
VKLAIITTHPIQYNAPWFKLLAERNYIQVKVFYTWEQAKDKVYDPLFKREIKWDIPLLDGYDFTFVRNIANKPGSHHFEGIDNPGLINELKTYQPDAILVFGWSFKSHLKVLRYFKGKIPLLFRGDSVLLNDKPGMKRIVRKIFLKWVYRHVDKALYVGENNKAYYQHAGLKEDQLIFAPHAIDNERFTSTFSESGTATNWRERLCISASDIVFLYAGKLEPRKNPNILIEAFKELKAPHTHLVMVGNGPLEEELKKACAAFKNIHFIDFQNQQAMPAIYHLSDVYVLPSKSETWGLAVNEAMACGKAVLVSDQCGCAIDLVEDGLNGYLFRSAGRADLLAKLNLIVQKGKQEIHEMGQESRRKIQNWSFEKICLAVESAVKYDA